jgi:hypothetical protein
MSSLYVLTHRAHLFLAYLSNPSEISFRSYLTEQSFRHHLSRLDDPADPDQADAENSKANYRSSSNQSSSSSFGLLESGPSAFHFSNRAAIALRTPRHAFHSFGFFTIAAVIPNQKAHPPSRESSSAVSSSHNTAGTSDQDIFPLKETWFVGAFGRWWKGGVVDPAWSAHPSPHSKGDEEGWSSGILSIKALDRLEDFNGKHNNELDGPLTHLYLFLLSFSPDASFLTGLPFPTTTHNPRSPQRSTPPKLRSRDRSTSRLPRSSTPPPLPKSAVLPLHTPKHSQSLTTPQPPVSRQRSLPQQHTSSTPVANGGTTNEPSPNFDSTPAIAELTQQISQTRALNLELRNQLSEHSSSATEVDATLNAELNSVREAKRVEDTARGELKARTKSLEDSRRAAEAGKRDAERRLRATQKAKAEAGTRIEKLGQEIRVLETQVQQDEVAVRVTAEEATQEELDIRARVKERQGEVRVVEEVVTALNVRVRELEDSIERERIVLAAAREKAQALQREQDVIPEQPLETWETISTSESSLTTSALEQRMGYEVLDPFPTPLEKDSDRGRERSGSGSVSTRSSPHLCALPVAPSINVGYGTPSQAHSYPNGVPDSHPRLPKGYSIFDENLASLSNPIHSAKFSPFSDSDVPNGNHTLTLIPKGLIQPPDGMSTSAVVGEIGAPGELLTRRQSNNETLFDRDWRRRPSVGSESHGHVFPRVDDGTTDGFEPFGIRPQSRHRMTSDPIDVSGVWLSRANSDSAHPPIAAARQQEAQTRRWRGPDKERRSTVDGTESRRGLNPDAKVFSFSAKPLFGVPAAPPFNCLNASTSDSPVSGAVSSGGTGDSPNGAATSSSTPGFFSGLAMRAFAPSPAEREALQRALGGSTNTSFERLPSLSEVGSMPTSPALNHVPAHPVASRNPPGMPWFDIGLGPGAGRNWLRELGASMPRPSNIKFSPWGDGDGDGIEADK